MLSVRYLYDTKRHLVCDPYSVDGLHVMARALGLKRCWYHCGKFPHYDLPKSWMGQMVDRRLVLVKTREIFETIRNAQQCKSTRRRAVMVRSGRYNPVEVDVSLKHETDKAWLFEYGDSESAWIAKSLAEYDHLGTVILPEWLAKEKGMI